MDNLPSLKLREFQLDAKYNKKNPSDLRKTWKHFLTSYIRSIYVPLSMGLRCTLNSMPLIVIFSFVLSLEVR